MEKPKIGDEVEAYFGERLQTATVVEWRGRWCYFSNHYRLLWLGESAGFSLVW